MTIMKEGLTTKGPSAPWTFQLGKYDILIQCGWPIAVVWKVSFSAPRLSEITCPLAEVGSTGGAVTWSASISGKAPSSGSPLSQTMGTSSADSCLYHSTMGVRQSVVDRRRGWFSITLTEPVYPATLKMLKPSMVANRSVRGSDCTSEVTSACLLYTSDAADDLLCVDLGG